MLRTLVALIGVSAVVAGPLHEARTSFASHRLVSALVPSQQAFEVAKSLGESGLLDLWTDVPHNHSIMFSVAPEHFSEVDSTLRKSNIITKVIEEDLQKVIDEEQTKQTYAPAANRPFNFRQFESYEQIVASINYYSNGPHSLGLVSSFVVGKSYEGRNIVGIKISNSATKKPIVFVECGIHAREWASTSTCLYMIDQLVSNQDAHKALLDRFEFHIVPSSNPDGYEFTRSSNRLWRKNRSPQGSNGWSRCVGVDLNRNFKAGPHCGIGTEKNPCSDVFCGPKPFSEPETAAIRDYMTKIQKDVEYYVSLHAFGLMWMFPYSYTSQHSKDHTELLRRAKVGVDAIEKKTGTEYSYGTIAETIYAVTGSSIDWAYELGIKKSFVLEVQPANSFGIGARGFLLPSDQIIAVGDETFTGLKAIWLS